MQNFIQRGRAFIMTTSIDLESVNPHRSIIITNTILQFLLFEKSNLADRMLFCMREKVVHLYCLPHVKTGHYTIGKLLLISNYSTPSLYHS